MCKYLILIHNSSYDCAKVKNVSPTAVSPGAGYPDRVTSSMGYSVSDAPAHQIPKDNYTASPVPEVVVPLTKDLKQSQYVNPSRNNGSAKESQQKKKRGRTRRANNDNYDADYTTGGESCDELDENWDREYPSISSDQQRQAYKRDFDAGLQEYKQLQAELDEISKELSRLDKDLDDYIEGSEEYKAAADEYNRLKDIKSSADYKNRKAHCKMLKSKLSHIKRMVSDYDSRKS
ncbi:PREDICTED: occludin [Thamnophis sirtalis]|uniref:Occludin n=1 Tax=Thamnophis sirtalis TaxID=35019 RepID=A0A6I9XXG1_9SAUR|nr:PREDICTED: occludin [Thamnophis sirtalis]